MQTQTSVPLVPSAPVSPEQRSRSHCQGMEQHAHLARFGRGAPAPLALLAQRTRTATANARPIDHAQASITFSTLLMRDQYVACRTSKGSIRLEGKVGPSEATSFPGRRSGRWSIPRSRRRGNRGDWMLRQVLRPSCRSELGSAHRFRHKPMSQFESEVPGPLGDDLPGFLSPGRVATLTIRLKFNVLVF